jgi:hypothetical protein
MIDGRGHMSSTTGRGPGRPPKQSPETAQKGREYLELNTKYDVPVGKIAEREGASPTWVFELIKRARAEAAAEQPPDPTPAAPGEAQKARPLRRLSRRSAQSRAWEYAEQRPVGALGLAANSFWIRLIVAVHEEGDGFRLRLGEPDSRFRTREDLADVFPRRAQLDIDGWLKELFNRGRLVDLDGIDIGIPSGLGLVPGENSRGEPLKIRAPAKPSTSAQAPLPFRPMLVPGGRSDSSEIPPSDSTEMPISLESDSSEIPNLDSTETRISLESANFARAASAAAYAKENQSLSSSSSTGSPASATQVKFGISVESDSSEITRPDSTEINLQRSPVAELTAELAILAGLSRAPNAEDLGWVEAWTEQGFSADTMRGVIEIKRGQLNGKRVTGLRYFDGPMQDSRKAKGRLATAPVATPDSPAPAAVSDADKALQDLLRPSQDAWRKDRSCPFAPILDTFKAAILTEKGKTLAYRWLELWAVWDRSNRPRDLKPPDFSLIVQNPDRFETALLEIEEELTAPDPPQAAD